MKKEKQHINGWLNLDKPVGFSSAKAVNRVRYLLNAKKAGHAGTLDPLASGILPIALGEATKTISFVTDSSKTYGFKIKFGEATNTDDMEGEIIEQSDFIPSAEEITKILPDFIGKISQIPPVYSAIKVDGKRSYKLAREGKEAKLEPRKVEIEDFKLTSDIKNNEAEFEVICGKGTYIRSLGRDLAKKLGSCGHISYLRRKKVGNFLENSAISLEKLETLVHNARPFEGLMPVEAVLDDIPVLNLNSSFLTPIRNGMAVKVDFQNNGRVSLMIDGKLIAIGNAEQGEIRPVRVFNY